MSVFVTGINTGVGKTVISAWLALQMGWSYFKPIQTGCANQISDSDYVASMGVDVYPEHYKLDLPFAPYVAALKEGFKIDTKRITSLPIKDKLIVEGAGGVMVPITIDFDMIDLIKTLAHPVLLVTSSNLGMINHTRLTLQMLNLRNIKVIALVIIGLSSDNKYAIKFFDNIEIVFEFPFLHRISSKELLDIKMTDDLRKIITDSTKPS